VISSIITNETTPDESRHGLAYGDYVNLVTHQPIFNITHSIFPWFQASFAA